MSSEENEMEVDEAPTRNGNVFAFEPLGMNVYAEIEEARNKFQKMKARITQRDKEYRSRKDPIKSDLYKGLKHYFKFYPGQYRAFLVDMSDERYEAFLKPKGGLEKSKALDVKYKIQRITEIMELKNQGLERAILYSTVGQLDLILASKHPDRYEWTTFRLLDQDPTGAVERMNKLPERAFAKTIVSKIREELESLEDQIQTADKDTFFYVHNKTPGGLVFVGIRRQVAPNPETGRKKPKRGRRSTKGSAQKGVKETSQTLTIVFKQGFPHFFINGSMSDSELVLKVLVESLGYGRYENQNLTGRDIPRLMKTCNAKFTAASLEVVEKSFREEEAKMAERGIFYGNRMTELNRRFQVATFRGAQRDPEGEPVVSPKKPGTEVITYTSTLGQSRMKIKGTAEDVDDYIIACYEQGFITDLMPYINLKRTQSNRADLGDGK